MRLFSIKERIAIERKEIKHFCFHHAKDNKIFIKNHCLTRQSIPMKGLNNTALSKLLMIKIMMGLIASKYLGWCLQPYATGKKYSPLRIIWAIYRLQRVSYFGFIYVFCNNFRDGYLMILKFPKRYEVRDLSKYSYRVEYVLHRLCLLCLHFALMLTNTW